MCHFKQTIIGEIQYYKIIQIFLMSNYSDLLIKKLCLKVRNYPRFSNKEIDKFCWMAAHEYKHGILPSEYDIREIDEDLYLLLLKEFNSKINN